MRFIVYLSLCFSLVFFPGGSAHSQETTVDHLAVDAIQHPADLQLTLWAGSNQLANPVAFHIDDQGVMYICETFRQNQGVEDNRGHMDWLDDDLAAQTLDDRLAYFKKHLGDEIAKYSEKEDRITRLVDANGDGKADQYSVYADGFDDILAGTGAGVLAHNGDVFYTCIPDVWKLNDTNGDGAADKRKSLHYGYGVRVAFRGHDSHGLVIGPDGRLYFSIGDRGYSIETEDGRKLHDPASGAVFRCELDGSGLEVYATGLRNPQELAFDDFGNLFTGDNNSDGGDQARLVHVVRGSDTGWRMYYQYLGDRGPWNREKLWHPKHDGQPAYVVPPICNFADGPSGLTYYPGTGLGDAYANTFFLCDFRGDAAMSGIRSFRFDHAGATFALADSEKFLWNVLATDVDFGPDGAMYLTDWIEGWSGVNRGRVIKVVNPEDQQRATRVMKMLQADTSTLKPSPLLRRLGHRDRRVRTKSQWELAKRNATHLLKKVATEDVKPLARVHAIWALGQISRSGAPEKKVQQAIETLLSLAKDQNSVIRKAALQTLDDNPTPQAIPAFIKGLEDADTAVLAAAATGISRYSEANVTDRIVQLLAENQDRDPVLRHACILALAGTCTADQIAALHEQSSVSVRRAAVVALRRQKATQVAEFLLDAEPGVVNEAALAIHDLPIKDAFPKLAALVRTDMTKDDALARRVLNANFRLGTPEHALAIADVMGQHLVSPAMELEALAMLESWSEPSSRDRVLGDWRPLNSTNSRSRAAAVAAIRQCVGRIPQCEADVAIEAIRLAADFGINEVAEIARGMIGDSKYSEQKRASLLAPLAELQPDLAEPLVAVALKDRSELVRAAARNVLVTVDRDRAVEELANVVKAGAVTERQAAFATLAGMDHASADDVLRDIAAPALSQGKLPKEVLLDAVTALEKRNLESAIQPFLDELEQQPYGKSHLATHGGNVDRGLDVFSNNVALSCTRCHKAGRSGGRVGPNLAGLGATKTPEYLLESIVDPNKVIAEGFGTLVVVTDDGQQQQGVLQKETNEYVQLVDAEGKQFLVMKDTIEVRTNGKSAMPEGLTKEISLFELRDLVAFLHSLREPWNDPAGHE